MPSLCYLFKVSTHSRPKAAVEQAGFATAWQVVSTHSRPKAAADRLRADRRDKMFQHTAARRRLMAMGLASRQQPVSTHSRPKAAVAPVWSYFCLVLFQHTAARRRLVREAGQPVSGSPFQHTAARRRLAAEPEVLAKGRASFNTQPPEGGCHLLYWIFATSFVSTHSRPKAAGHRDRAGGSVGSFNTQPPEGGCPKVLNVASRAKFQHTAARRRLRRSMPPNTPCACFNTQPPEGGCRVGVVGVLGWVVSTHSRPKAAASCRASDYRNTPCFNTQPPEGGCGWPLSCTGSVTVSTHSRPKAAELRFLNKSGSRLFQHTAARRRLQSRHGQYRVVGGFNTQPPEGGCLQSQNSLPFAQVSTHSRPKAAEKFTPPKLADLLFQHTAARRRLVLHYDSVLARTLFQHTAARRRLTAAFRCRAAGRSFNTQPPEGGWVSDVHFVPLSQVSTHSRPKAAGGMYRPMMAAMGVSTHSRPKAAEYWYAPTLPATLFQHTAARRRLSKTKIFGRKNKRFNTQPPEGGCPSSIRVPGRYIVSTHSRPKAAGRFM